MEFIVMMTRYCRLCLLILAAGLFATPSVEAADEHRIAIRTIDGRAEFYDRTTGDAFLPRGNNYVELRPDPTHSFLISSLFFPTYHDAADIEYDFERMQALGYNTARVFIDLCRDEDCIGDPNGGLRDDYMDNVVDLLHIAQRRGIFVLLTANWLPDFGGYLDVHATCKPTFQAGNCLLLSAEGVASYKRFFQDFVQALLDREAPLDIILGYQLRNEVFFEANRAPLSWESGEVTTANGKSYDMASSEERAQMIDEGLIYWANEARAAIQALDPTALVTAGFFAPNEPHNWRPGDARLVRTQAVLRDSDLDFLDFHAYPDAGLSLAQVMENFGMVDYEAKPILLGEVGAFRSIFPSPALGAAALQTWQAAACTSSFDGFLLWYWDPINSPLVGDNVWGPHDGVGEIAHALAPVFQPDPCAPGPATNLALGKPVTASAALDDQPPEQAVDGRLDTNWGAGSGPPQWIEIDLLESTDIGRIGLLTEQFPDGFTEHHVSGKRSPSGPYELLHTFSGQTTAGQWLEEEPATPWTGYRWIRIETTMSPSWVSWYEIHIYPPQDDGLLPLPPALVEPGPRAEDLSEITTLQWETVPGALTYNVQVSLEADFRSILYEVSTSGSTQANTEALEEGTTYYWRVQAVNDVGGGPWSATRRFSVGIPTGVDRSERRPRSAIVHAFYPNPFQERTTLQFELTTAAHVELVVYDVMGRKVAALLDERMQPGTHRVQWHPAGLSSGIYYYRLTTNDFQTTGALLQVK